MKGYQKLKEPKTVVTACCEKVRRQLALFGDTSTIKSVFQFESPPCSYLGWDATSSPSKQ